MFQKLRLCIEPIPLRLSLIPTKWVCKLSVAMWSALFERQNGVHIHLRGSKWHLHPLAALITLL